MKAGVELVETFDLPYDYASLMHYPGNAFAKTHKNITIMALVSRRRETLICIFQIVFFLFVHRKSHHYR